MKPDGALAEPHAPPPGFTLAQWRKFSLALGCPDGTVLAWRLKADHDAVVLGFETFQALARLACESIDRMLDDARIGSIGED